MAKGWSIPPTAFIGEIEAGIEQRQRQIAAEALGAIISGSPVDEGAYRENHRVTIDSEDHGYDATAGAGKGSEPPLGATAGVEAYSEGLRIIARAPAFSVIRIQNNIPYGERLENGHSKQAPNGVYGLAYIGVSEKYGQ